MAVVAWKIKVMPESPDTDLKAIKESSEKILNELGARRVIVEEEPIAFGIVAVILTVAWPEEKASEEPEARLKAIKGVSSVETIDYRRAIG